VTFSPDGTTLASGGRDAARLWDVATGRLLLNLGPRPLDFATGLTFSSDGRRLAGSSKVGFAAGEVVVWELDDGQGIRTLRGLQSHVSKVCFAPDGKLLAALAHNWQVAIWELDSGRLKASLEVPQGDTADNAALAFSPDGRSFAFSTLTQGKLWDLDTAQEVRNWNLPPGYQDTLAFHPSGKLLLFRFERRDGKRVCLVRDLLGSDPARPLPEITTFDRQVFRIAAPPDGSYFLVNGQNGTDERRLLGLFDGTTGKQLWLVPGSLPELDPGGTVMRFQDSDAKLILVEMPSGRPLKDSLIPKRAGVLSPGARYILAGNQGIVPGQEDSISLFRRGEPSPLVTFVGLHPEILFSPAGSHAAWGNPDGSVSLCDIEQVRARLSQAGLGW
jgi:WD40 repeat protein